MISFEEFKRLSLKTARIKNIKDHPNADRLYVVTLEIGNEEKQVVAGLKKAYKSEELKDKLVMVVENLEPATIRGVESQGMILAAQDGETLSVLCPDKKVSSGAIIK